MPLDSKVSQSALCCENSLYSCLSRLRGMEILTIVKELETCLIRIDHADTPFEVSS